MEIHGVKLNKKNFWIPFLVSSVLSFLFYFFGMNYIFYSAVKILSEGNAGSYFSYLSLSLYTFPFTIFLVFLPVFFIIKRLLNKKPKKVFYFELPILIVIYSTIVFINQIIGLMIGGPVGMTTLQIVTLIIPQIIFIAIWIFLLTISLYFYYKKINIVKTR